MIKSMISPIETKVIKKKIIPIIYAAKDLK